MSSLSLSYIEKNYSVSDLNASMLKMLPMKEIKKPEDESPGLVGFDKDWCGNLTLSKPANLCKGFGMSDQIYRKLISSPEVIHLLCNHHNAFILMSYLALRAARVQTGDLMPGDCEMPGEDALNMTRKEYRGAYEKLIDLGYIEWVYNKQARPIIKKRAIKRAIEKGIVNILNSRVYDINLEDEGQRNGQPGASEGPAIPQNCDSPPSFPPPYTPSYPSAPKELKNERKEKQAKAPPSLPATSLLAFFNSSLSKNIPEVSEPCSDKMALHFDALLEKSFTPEEIESVITFCHTGWWAQYVHTPKYLREKFTQLLAASRRANTTSNSSNKKPVYKNNTPTPNGVKF